MSEIATTARTQLPPEAIPPGQRQGTYMPVPLDVIRIASRPNVKDRASRLFFNPRSTQGFDDDHMAELEESIAADGLIHPIAVRDEGGGSYQLVWGERRLRAIRALVDREQQVYCEAAGGMLPAIEVYGEMICRIVNCDDERAIALAWAENDRHVAISEADVLDLCERLSQMDYPPAAIGKLLRKKPSWISQTFSFAEKLPPQVYEMLRQGQITRSYAVRILEQPEAMREELAFLADEIAEERYEEELALIQDDREEVEEDLDEAVAEVVLADEAPPSVQRQVRKKLARVERQVAEVEAKEKKVRGTGVVRQRGDVDEAARRKGLAPAPKGMSVKAIYAEYIDRASDLIDRPQEIERGKRFLPRDLEIAHLVATGIAEGNRDFVSLLSGHYEAMGLWAPPKPAPPGRFQAEPDFPPDDPSLLEDDLEDESDEDDLGDEDDDEEEDLDSLLGDDDL